LFEAAEPWNTTIDADPKDATSDAIINWLSNNGGWGAGSLRIDFSITLQHAVAGTPFMAFSPTGAFYSPDCDQVPFPVPAGGAIEGENGYSCAGGGDCHLLVVDDANKKLYEMWRAFAPAGQGGFPGGCAAVWDLTKAYPPNLRGDGCTSADAGGFPISAMLFTADEVAAGNIQHAIRFILPNDRIRGGNVYVHPGTHTTSATSGAANAPPYGVRFRLKANADLSGLSANAKVIAQALQKYGMFLSDGGNIALTGADDRFSNAKWANLGVDSFSLSSLPVSAFEVVNLGAVVNAGDCARNP
jgi:serine/threonine-protein kinase